MGARYLFSGCRRCGFTLIELLSAMTILVTLVMLMARVFNESSNMWQSGQRRISGAMEGRVIMDLLVREMSLSIADDIVAFKLNSDQADTRYSVPAYGAESDEVAFIAMTRAGTDYFRRNANQFVYFVAPMLDENGEEMPHRYRLVRTRRTRTVFNNRNNRETGPYGRPPSLTGNRFWWHDMEPDWEETGNPALRSLETVAENIAAFEVWAWSEDANGYQFSYDSVEENNLLPLWMDLYLEMLSEPEAIQAAALWESDQDRAREFIEANVQRFTARIHFPNRERALAFRE